MIDGMPSAPFSAVTLAPEARVQGYQVQSPWLIKLEIRQGLQIEEMITMSVKQILTSV